MDVQKFQRLKSKILSSLAEIEADIQHSEAISRTWRSMMAQGFVCVAWTDCREFSRWLRSQNVKGRAFRVVRLDDTRPYSPENCIIER